MVCFRIAWNLSKIICSLKEIGETNHWETPLNEGVTGHSKRKARRWGLVGSGGDRSEGLG